MIYILLMNELHLGSVDLNLLVVLDALLVERNVTRAAARVGITQSAASHALARLRTLTDDELLVRGREGMVPTARAEALTGPVRRALDEIARALAPARPFDPKTATGKVRIGTSDYAELVLLPRLVQRLAVEAPGIDLRATMLGDDPRSSARASSTSRSRRSARATSAPGSTRRGYWTRRSSAWFGRGTRSRAGASRSRATRPRTTR